MKYKLHKQFNMYASSARIRKPATDDASRANALLSKLLAIQAKSNVGPKLKLVRDSEGNLTEWQSDTGWYDIK